MYSGWPSTWMDREPVIFGVGLCLLVFSLQLFIEKSNFSVEPGSPDRNTTADTFSKLWSTKKKKGHTVIIAKAQKSIPLLDERDVTNKKSRFLRALDDVA